MRIQRAKINNFRGIAKTEIEFKPGFNIIAGENGTGKTSVLEAISVGLGGFVAGIPEIATRHFSSQEIHRVSLLSEDGSVHEKETLPMEVELDAVISGETFHWIRSRSSAAASRTTITPRDICRKAEQMSMDEQSEMPILLYKGAERTWPQKRGKADNIVRKNYYRTDGYADALVDASNVKLLLNWCVKMEMVSWQKGKKIAEYEAVKEAVGKFVQRVNGAGECRIFYDRQAKTLMFQNGIGIFPIEELSAGCQSLIWLVFDIAYRMAVLNPNYKERITETAGVVLVDDLELHLHPKWQWNVIGALRDTFPNVQFIAATHAPILLSSAPNVWIIRMKEEKIKSSWSHFGLDVNATLEKYQGTDCVIPAVQRQIDLFYQKLDDEQYGQAQQILNQLQEATAPEHPLLVQMQTALDLELES